MEKKVFFKHNQDMNAGILYMPDGFREDGMYAAIVISAPAGAVKEQSPSVYGKKIAEKGFVTLVFDTYHQGESGGEPRQLENPADRIEDIKCAVDYLTTLSYVDNDRIGAMGICSGGGYSVHTACTEKRIKAVAGVSSSDPGSWIRDGIDGKVTKEELLGMLTAVGAQRTAEANGADPIYGNFVPEVVTEDMEPRSTLREANHYYRTERGGHKNSTNLVSMMSLDKMIDFITFGLIDKLLTQPLLLIVGSDADTKHYSKEAVAKATTEKEYFEIQGASHCDLYDIQPYVDQAIEKLTVFFEKNLY